MRTDIVIIDGDFIPYRVAYSAQSNNMSMKQAMNMAKRLVYSFCEELHSNHIIGFLGGKDNFRKTLIDKLSVEAPEYKGNRTGNKAPYHNDIINYLKEYFGFTVIDGIEADDAVAIVQNTLTEDTAIVSTDKDLLQVPGKHLQVKHTGLQTFDVNEFGEITVSKNNKKIEATGDLLLYSQLLTGDSADNFKGVPKCGPVKANLLLKEAKDKQELQNIVYAEYQKAYKDDAIQMFKLMWNLAYILRFHKDLSKNIPTPLNILL